MEVSFSVCLKQTDKEGGKEGGRNELIKAAV